MVPERHVISISLHNVTKETDLIYISQNIQQYNLNFNIC
jgi:hypothetical protein